jgi:hypothetical protein
MLWEERSGLDNGATDQGISIVDVDQLENSYAMNAFIDSAVGPSVRMFPMMNSCATNLSIDGDDCVVEAGSHLTAVTGVAMSDGGTAKTREPNGRSGLLFRRNSQTGAVEVLKRRFHGDVESRSIRNSNRG